MGTKYSYEVETERKKVFNRIEGIIFVKKESQKKCSKLDNCNYISDMAKAGNFTISQSHGYLTLVCEKYPGACELNLSKLNK